MKFKNDFLFKASFFSMAVIFAFGFLLAASADDTKTFYLDSDGDGYGNAEISATTTEATLEGYVLNDEDCNDEDASINPGATEVCDGVDNNCSGEIDDGVKNTYYLDSDGDGFGDPQETILACEGPTGYVDNNNDCDDSNSEINPNAPEVCDGVDNNCNGEINEDLKNTYFLDNDEDGYGQTDEKIEDCSMPEGYAVLNNDCDDEKPNVYPGATEIYNSIDDNCNGQIDENLVFKTFYRDFDGDGFGNSEISTSTVEAPSGYVLDNTDCNDADASVNPEASELCDGKDNNCNEQVDEGLKKLFYYDGDGDGFGNSSKTTLACSAPNNYVLKYGDCNDGNNTVYPGAEELEDDLDNNCNGLVDEDYDEEEEGEEEEENEEEGEEDCNKYKNTYKNQYGEFKNFGQFVKSMAHQTNALKKEGKITGKEKGKIMSSLKRK